MVSDKGDKVVQPLIYPHPVTGAPVSRSHMPRFWIFRSRCEQRRIRSACAHARRLIRVFIVCSLDILADVNLANLGTLKGKQLIHFTVASFLIGGQTLKELAPFRASRLSFLLALSCRGGWESILKVTKIVSRSKNGRDIWTCTRIPQTLETLKGTISLRR